MSWVCVTALDAASSALLVSVIPNAKRTEAVGLHDGCLRVRLAAPALEGRANEALVAWLSAELALPRRDVVIKQGASSRRKRVLLACDASKVESWLDRLGFAAA